MAAQLKLCDVSSTPPSRTPLSGVRRAGRGRQPAAIRSGAAGCCAQLGLQVRLCVCARRLPALPPACLPACLPAHGSLSLPRPKTACLAPPSDHPSMHTVVYAHRMYPHPTLTPHPHPPACPRRKWRPPACRQTGWTGCRWEGAGVVVLVGWVGVERRWEGDEIVQAKSGRWG